MEGRPLALKPIGQGAYRNRANTIGNTENIWEVNINQLANTLRPGNQNTRFEKRNMSWANKPLQNSTLPPLPPSPKTPVSRKQRKQRTSRKSRKSRRQRK